MTLVHITQAQVSDLDAAAQVLAEAFTNDPVLHAILSGEDRRNERLTTLFRATLAAGAFAAGSVDLAHDERGVLLGVAAWEGPRAPRWSLARQLRELPRFAAALGWGGIARALPLLSRLERHRPGTPHWYLAEIGVTAAARGRGVGRQLIESRLTALDHAGESSYLESSTPENRRLYARLGFTELAPISGLPGAEPVAMIRPPTPRRSAADPA